ncbi:MAG: D-hexose-6-phosphate mutarotase [Oceanospirillaceae bacterium]|nr:D-hexose-6-phosphate mutarotase [Oceanospirillaceae bacterium]
MRQQLQVLLDALPEGMHEQVLEDFELLLIKGRWGELALARQGAQVLHYRAAGAAPLLWLSDCLKAPPAAIRGGVPLCWPWFGDHPSQASQPAHGVARTARWDWSLDENGADGVTLRALPAAALWPGLEAQVTVRVHEGAIDIVLDSRNVAQETVELTQALHTYLAVGWVGEIEVRGLRGCEYLDKLQGGAGMRQDGELRIASALDRIYRHEGVIEVRDPVLQRCLRVVKSGSASTVVWNPGDGALSMVDVGMEQQPHFICVEAANTVLDPVRLAPGERSRLATRLSATALS